MFIMSVGYSYASEGEGQVAYTHTHWKIFSAGRQMLKDVSD
jgi:hypothetical protein